MTEPNAQAVKPFISWAGSKRRLLTQITPHLPTDYEVYVEPFLGGGSLFLQLAPSSAILNDACAPLVDTWNAIARNPSGVHKEAVRRPLEKDAYYRARAERGGGYLQQAGRFIYLNKGAFNGLYRVNLKGEFNVPWGAPKSDFVADKSNLVSVSAALQAVDGGVRHGDFEQVVDRAQAGALLFLDPPYVTSHNANGFIEYNEKIFSWGDQVRLADAAEKARRRGAHVVVTNANHDSVTELYPTFEHVVIERPSTLAASISRRGRTTEILMIGRPE